MTWFGVNVHLVAFSAFFSSLVFVKYSITSMALDYFSRTRSSLWTLSRTFSGVHLEHRGKEVHVGLAGAYREGMVSAVRRDSRGYRGRRWVRPDLGRDDGAAGAVLSSPRPKHSRAPHAGSFWNLGGARKEERVI